MRNGKVELGKRNENEKWEQRMGNGERGGGTGNGNGERGKAAGNGEWE